MPSFLQRRQALKAAFAEHRSHVDMLRIACDAAGANYRTVHIPPMDAMPSADASTVKRWPLEAYPGRPYQLRCDGPRERLTCPRGALEGAA